MSNSIKITNRSTETIVQESGEQIPLFFQNMVPNTFKKDEKLSSQKIIGEIFLSGNTFICYPLKVIWINNVIITGPYDAIAAFSVPKKNFKKAHERNHIRRKMRESYRYLKNNFYDFLKKTGQKIALIIVFIGKEDISSDQIKSAMIKSLDRLQRDIIKSKGTF